MKISALAFIDINSAATAILSAEGFKFEVDDAVNGILSAEAEASDILNALALCESFAKAEIIGIINYEGKEYDSDEFFEKEFTDEELGLL